MSFFAAFLLSLGGEGWGLSNKLKQNSKKRNEHHHASAATVDKDSRYVLQVGKNRFIDAEKPLNPVGRYINDPKGTGKRANVRVSASRTTERAGRQTVPVMTRTKIKPNTELFMSYGKDFWQHK
jgi:hypothetical protein